MRQVKQVKVRPLLLCAFLAAGLGVLAAPPRGKSSHPIANSDAMFTDHGGQLPWAEACVLETPHYLVRSNVPKAQLLAYGRILEAFHHLLVQFFGVKKDPGLWTRVEASRSEVWIYGTEDAFIVATEEEDSVGLYDMDTRRLTTYHGMHGEEDEVTNNTRTTLAHEGTHQFHHLIIGDRFESCPEWLGEGFASFVEGADYDWRRHRARIGRPVPYWLVPVQEALAAGEAIPFADLIRTEADDFSADHYAHAWSVIYAMAYPDAGHVERTRYRGILNELFYGPNRTPEEVEEIFGGRDGLLAFEEIWARTMSGLDPGPGAGAGADDPDDGR